LSNPYEALGSEAFWRSAVAGRAPEEIGGLWAPKWPLSKDDKVVTAGSCFAQHIGRALAAGGYAWFDAEPASAGLSAQEARERNYGIFSFRTGNIYSVALLKQWLQWSFGEARPPNEIWQAAGRFYDPFRPAIEPDGFDSPAASIVSREQTFAAIRRAVEEARVFVFTLGLTEAWQNERTGCVYPMCPGTVAGEFDSAVHRFHNYRYPEIRADLEQCFALMRARNPQLRFLLTVSPVPLTATAAGKHVLVATIHSKSTLRAVAGDLADARQDVDYFPSYEIIGSFPFRGDFYENNMRTVTPEGVAFVMRSFFAGLQTRPASEASRAAPPPSPAGDEDAVDDDVVCEDILLEAFGKE
jgi:hypothetical protein